MLKCGYCGEELISTRAFCPSCGKPTQNHEQESYQSSLPTLPVGFSSNANTTELHLDCSACKTATSMTATKVPKFSGVIRVIGGILLIPSFLGMGFAILMFGEMMATMAMAANDKTGVAAAASGIIPWLIVGLTSLVGGLLGWLLLLNRSVWRCGRCGYILDRA